MLDPTSRNGVHMPPKTKNPVPRAPALPDVGFVRLPQVLAVLPIGKSTWWAGVKNGKYPAAVKLGPRVSAWRVEDIRGLIADIGAPTQAERHARTRELQ
jgi:prophage regulatory protein